jgi:hypothetical protein
MNNDTLYGALLAIGEQIVNLIKQVGILEQKIDSLRLLQPTATVTWGQPNWCQKPSLTYEVK